MYTHIRSGPVTFVSSLERVGYIVLVGTLVDVQRCEGHRYSYNTPEEQRKQFNNFHN